MKTYSEIQKLVAKDLGVRPNSVKTCWIAEAKRELGLTRGKAPNTGQGRGAPPCLPKYKEATMRVLKQPEV